MNSGTEGGGALPLEAESEASSSALLAATRKPVASSEGAAASGPFSLSSFSVESVAATVEALINPSAAGTEIRTASGVRREEAEGFLLRFQRDPSAWQICVTLLHEALKNPAAVSAEAAYFAAQTLAAQARAGFPHQLKAALGEGKLEERVVILSGVSSWPGVCEVLAHIRDGLVDLVFNFRRASRPVLLQLCVALAAALAFSCVYRRQTCGEQRMDLRVVVEALGGRPGDEGFEPLLEFLAMLPEELAGKRMALPEDQRLTCLVSCVSEAPFAVEAILRMFGRLQGSGVGDSQQHPQQPSPFVWNAPARAALQAVQAWLTAALFVFRKISDAEEDVSAEARYAIGRTFGAFKALDEAVQKVAAATSNNNNPTNNSSSQSGFLDRVLAAVVSDDAELLQLSSECVNALLDAAQEILQNELVEVGAASQPTTAEARKREMENRRRLLKPLLARVVGVYGEGCAAALSFAQTNGGLEGCDRERLQVFGQGLVSLARRHLPVLLCVVDEEAREIAEGNWGLRHSASELAASLRNAAETICALALRLLAHSALEIKAVGLDFFRNMLKHLVVFAQKEELLLSRRLCWTENRLGEGAAADAELKLLRFQEERANLKEDFSSRHALQRETFRAFAEVLPLAIEAPESLFSASAELDAWWSFREDCAATLAQVADLIGLEAVSRKTAALLRSQFEGAVFRGSFGSGSEWRLVDARLFVLATLAASEGPPPWTVLSGAETADGKAGSGGDGGAAGLSLFLKESVFPLLQLIPQLPLGRQLPSTGEAHAGGQGCAGADGSLSSSGEENQLRRWEAAERNVAALFLVSSLARLINKAAFPLMEENTALFAPLFQFCACQALPLCAEAAHETDFAAASREVLKTQLEVTETQLVAAICALAAAAAPSLSSSSTGEEDARRVLNALTSLLSREGLSMDARSVLLQAAGIVISVFDAPRLRMFLSHLLESLARSLEEALSEDAPAKAQRQSLQLFFSAVQAVRPIQEFPAPALLSQQGPFEPLPTDLNLRHPVLDVVERVWPTAERAMTKGRRSEFLFEVSTNGMVALFANCKAFAPRYKFFYAFLETFVATFCEFPTVFHLGALRSLESLYHDAREDFVHRALETALKACAQSTFQKLQADGGGSYLYEQPDIVGMTFDCVNVALLHASTARVVMAAPWFREVAMKIVEGAPFCNHPKVLHTSVVFTSRLAVWVDAADATSGCVAGCCMGGDCAAVRGCAVGGCTANPFTGEVCAASAAVFPELVSSPKERLAAEWWAKASEDAQRAVRLLLNEPFVFSQGSGWPAKDGSAFGRGAPLTFLEALVASLILSLTNVHAAVESWIGSAGQTLTPLLHSAVFGQRTLLALENAVAALPEDVCSMAQKREFFRNCAAKNLLASEMAVVLKRLADDSEAAMQRRVFAEAAAADASSEAFP